MITIPIAVHNEFFKWQLDLFWYNHKLIYGDEAYNKAIAIIIKRNTSKETKPETVSWNLDIPKKLCDSYFDYLNINENGYLLPLNIQIGLLQILNEIDDNETIELTDCDMFHIKKYEDVEIKEDEFYVCDIYEKWHLLSTNENKNVVQKYLNNNTILYNGGFVPIIGLCKTFKKIIDDWISIHKNMVLNDNHEHLIKWWSGMYSFQAACQNNNVKMISKDYCYVPEINNISEFHHIVHYSVDKSFNKTLFPKVELIKFKDNIYYNKVKKWFLEKSFNSNKNPVSILELENLFFIYLNRKPYSEDIAYHKHKSYAVLEYELKNCEEHRNLLIKKNQSIDNSVLAEEDLLLEDQVKIAIGSNKAYSDKTLPVCLPSLIGAGIKRSNIVVFLAGYKERKTYIKNEIQYIELDHNSLENSAFIDIAENELKSDYWFFMHDTCKVGKKFKNLMLNIPKKSTKVALRPWPSMSIGIYSYDYIKKYKDKLLKIKNKNYDYDVLMQEKLWGIPNEDYILWLEEPENTLIYRNFHMSVIDNENWFGGDALRITEYHKSIDLYKNKSNWEKYRGKNLSL